MFWRTSNRDTSKTFNHRRTHVFNINHRKIFRKKSTIHLLSYFRLSFNVDFECTRRHEKKFSHLYEKIQKQWFDNLNREFNAFKIDDLHIAKNDTMNSCRTWKIMFEFIALNYHVNVTFDTRTNKEYCERYQ
jgi:hypothetical protein